MVTQQRFIDADAYWECIQQPEYAERLVELIEGEIVEMTKPGGRHGEITFEIGRLIGNFVREHQLGRVTAAETGFVLEKRADGRDSVRGIDVAFVRMERAPEGLPEKPVPFAPDLAIEVISPGNAAGDIHKKVLQLLNAGTSLVWIVYPETQTVVVETRDGAKTYTIDDTLDGGAVLPGFTLPVQAIFAV